MSDVTLLTQVVAANPTDTTARLVLADAVQDAGDEYRAAAMRREAAALELRAKIVEEKFFAASCVFTLGTATAASGYGARAAERYLAANPTVLVYVYDDTAITKTGFAKSPNGPIVYHRKSSGGKWSRSVQMHRVSL